MKTVIRLTFSFLALTFAVTFPYPTGAHDTPPGEADVHVFVREGCPHCAAFRDFVNSWGSIEVVEHEVTERDSQELFAKVQQRLPSLQQGVPTIVIDGVVIQGFDTEETTGLTVKAVVEQCRKKGEECVGFEEFLKGEGEPKLVPGGAACEEECLSGEDSKYVFDFWMIGEVDLRDLSLPALSLLLGGLDGFNPCAMWMLITLLTLLINTHDWRKVWVVGGTFIFVSGVMYYLFIAAWLNVFLLVGLNVWVQKLIGLVAIGGGGFYLYEAFGKEPHACRVTDQEKRRRTIEKMRAVIATAKWPAMIFGVSVLAVSVNMIELVCTAGLPAVFTEILAFNPITNLQRYFYLLLYILAYMIDDLIIFAIAITTLRVTGLTTRYRRFTFILGGVLMLVLGFLLIFYPEALVLG